MRNLVCVGADPTRIAILDNFCWPSCKDPRNMGALVRAAEGCYDAAKAYRTPFISGKDSLNNQFVTEGGRVIQIPPTLLISGFAPVERDDRAVSMDAKRAGSRLVAVGRTSGRLGGSHFAQVVANSGSSAALPEPSLSAGPAAAAAVARAIAAGLVLSAHDCSDGGLLCAAAEMAFSGGLGLSLDLASLPVEGSPSLAARCFAEDPSRYLLEVSEESLPRLREALGDVPFAVIGSFEADPVLRLAEAGTVAEIPVAALAARWSGGLSW